MNAQITGLTVDRNSGDTLNAIRKAYNGLTRSQKKLVALEKLDAADKKLADILAADKAAVSNVEALIAAIGEVTKDSGDAIKAARNAYNALDAYQKEQIASYQVLTDAEAAYAEATKDPSNPGTGDHMPVMLLACMALISLMAIAVIPAIRKKVTYR